jgi:pimeloyl-ACP methyl ester carboxylesterase
MGPDQVAAAFGVLVGGGVERRDLDRGARVTAANGRHVVVPDSGHYIHVDKPDLVTKWIRDVVSRTR